MVIWDVRRAQVLESWIGEFSLSVHIRMERIDDWWFSRIYGPNKVLLRESFWDEIAGLQKVVRNGVSGGILMW